MKTKKKTKTNSDTRKELITAARAQGLEFDENTDKTVFMRKAGSDTGIGWSDLTNKQLSMLEKFVAACEDGEKVSKW